MKLRMKGNSIRLRLMRPEVERLASAGMVEEETRFPDGSVFRYRLVGDAGAAEPGAVFAAGTLTVSLPVAAVQRWARETIVGMEHATPLKGGGELKLLIEKDFACLTPRAGESDAEAFENPAACGGGGVVRESRGTPGIGEV